MIENYFLTGVRLQWIPPKEGAAVLDGKIIDNPLTPLNKMMYDGMDDSLVSGTHVSTTGLQMKQDISYRWLAYAPGRTTKLGVAGTDVLTGKMSGCLICTWTKGGSQFVGHVGTIDSNPNATRLVKQEFAKEVASATSLSGFDPYAAWPVGEVAALQSRLNKMADWGVYALVTGPNSFYSILVFSLMGNDSKIVNTGGVINGMGMNSVAYEKCVGGIKKIPSMSVQAIRQRLTA